MNYRSQVWADRDHLGQWVVAVRRACSDLATEHAHWKLTHFRQSRSWRNEGHISARRIGI